MIKRVQALLHFFPLPLFLFLMSFFTISILGGCQQTKEDTLLSQEDRALSAMAERMQSSGGYEAALRYHERILEKNPRDLKERLSMARTLRYMGRFEEAVKVLKELSQEFPHHSDSQQELGKNFISLNDHPNCLKVYQALLKEKPSDVLILNGLGVCYDIARHHLQAQKCYRQALDVDPNILNIKANLGLSLALTKKFQEALPLLEETAQSPQATPRDRQNLAILYGLMGNLEKAAELFSVDLDQNHVRHNLAYFRRLEKLESVSVETLSVGPSKNLSEAVHADADPSETSPDLSTNSIETLLLSPQEASETLHPSPSLEAKTLETPSSSTASPKNFEPLSKKQGPHPQPATFLSNNPRNRSNPVSLSKFSTQKVRKPPNSKNDLSSRAYRNKRRLRSSNKDLPASLTPSYRGFHPAVKLPTTPPRSLSLNYKGKIKIPPKTRPTA